jgi:signal transduction histidine kinase
MRLTLLYAGLFLLLGTGLLAITYVATQHISQVRVSESVHGHGRGSVQVSPAGPKGSAGSAGPKGSAGSAVSAEPAPPGLPPAFQKGINDIAVATHDADLDHLLTVSWIVLAVTTVGAAVLGWFAAGRVLRPVREITATARTISAGNLHARLARAGPEDEFKQLGDTLDELLGRLEGSFEAQRRFVANASHELRTPLTLERTLLQVALADPNANEQTLRATCQELLVSQAEHERLLEALLTLASSERGLEHHEPVELSALTTQILARLPPEAARLNLSVQTDLELASTYGDPALIRRLIANLIDNAVDHNIPGGRVEVRTASQDGTATLTVTNTGPHIPSDQTERLFEPFQRLVSERTGADGHHGLGLSIVRAIATAHGATVAARAQPAGGLAVTVDFPKASSSEPTGSASSTLAPE